MTEEEKKQKEFEEKKQSAEENFQRIQKIITPYVKKGTNGIESTAGKWTVLPERTTIINSNKTN